MNAIQEYISRNKPHEKNEDEDDINDVTLKLTDPLHVLAFKKIIEGGITQYAYERTIKALNYAPRDKDLNLIAVHWFIKQGKYLLA